MARTLRRVGDLLVAGTAWGVVAVLLGRRAFRGEIWTGFLLTPLIGLLVGGLLQPAFERLRGMGRSLIALLSLYLGAALFGLGLRIGTWTDVGETLLGIWWGITFTGFLLFLWPLAYLTHWLLEWRATG